MLGDKQEQAAEGGSTAIQAGGDVHYHGLSIADVREICTLILRDNFPRLREEAGRAAEQYARDFASKLEARLVKDAPLILLDKFREPDVQAAINDAVQASARKGQNANPEILSTLIAERVAKKTSDYKDVVISEAVTVVPKLTAPQIGLISFIHFVTSMNIVGARTLVDIERPAQSAMLFSKGGFNLSDSQKAHIEYTGACFVNSILGGDIYDEIRKVRYGHLGNFPDSAAFKAAVAIQAPSFAALLAQFDKENLLSIKLTSVGQAIALANISNFFGVLDYAIWLN